MGNGAPNGGAGTIYLQGPGRESGELVVDNTSVIAPNDTTPLFTVPTGSLNLTAIKIRRGAKAKIDVLSNVLNGVEVSTDARLVTFDRILASTVQVATRSTLESVDVNAATTFQVTDNSVVAHPPVTGTILRKLLLNSTSVTIDATSRIDVSGRGFLGASQPGNPFPFNGTTLGFQLGSGSGGGGSYGGLGGGPSNPVYGTAANPNEVGSGGGSFGGQAGNGGGLVRIVAQTLALSGAIRANGMPPTSGGGSAGGSGGGIRIDVATLSGSGSVTTNGGLGFGNGGGGGGGGRIAIYYQDATSFNFVTQVTATGGVGNGAPNGQNGTIFTRQQTFLGLLPMAHDEPVMKAEAGNSVGNDPVRLAAMEGLGGSENPSKRKTIPDMRALLDKAMAEAASADRPQRRIFSPTSVLSTQHCLSTRISTSPWSLKENSNPSPRLRLLLRDVVFPICRLHLLIQNPKSKIQNWKTLIRFTPTT